MEQNVYLKKFSHALHWRLPKSEADDILADYNELLSQHLKDDQDFPAEKMGDPVQAARMLSNSKAYHRWLAVFGVLALCLLVCEFLLLRSRFSSLSGTITHILYMVGGAAAFGWFFPRRRESRRSPFPKGLLPAVLGMLVLSAAVGAIVFFCLTKTTWALIPAALHGRVVQWVLWLIGTGSALLAAFGLIQARLSDRRWCSLYIMGLTLLTECVLVLMLLTSMSLDTSSFHWWMPYLLDFSLTGGIGLAAAGVSLC